MAITFLPGERQWALDMQMLHWYNTQAKCITMFVEITIFMSKWLHPTVLDLIGIFWIAQEFLKIRKELKYGTKCCDIKD